MSANFYMNKSTSVKFLIEQYFDELKHALDTLNRDDILQIINLLMDTYKKGRKIFIFGNGGGASNASHMACDLSKGTLARAYDEKEKRLRVLSLNDNMALFSAMANDLSYTEVFKQQMMNLVKKGDLIIVLSGSGNSRNLIEAVKYAKKCGARTVGLLGFMNGGSLAKMVDYSIIVQNNSYGPVEDVHLVLNHIITTCFAKLKHANEKSLQIDNKAVPFQQKKIILLDRDGVINQKPETGEYVKNWKEFIFLPKAIEALKILNKKGYSLFIITNQAGIGRGIMSEVDLKEIHKKLISKLKRYGVELSGIYYCPHAVNDGCDCRKPKAGLINKAARENNFLSANAIFIGDDPRDAQAGKNAGCKTIILKKNESLFDIATGI